MWIGVSAKDTKPCMFYELASSLDYRLHRSTWLYQFKNNIISRFKEKPQVFNYVISKILNKIKH